MCNCDKFSTMDLKIEDILLRIRDQLNKDDVKLWLPPYTVNEKSSENDQEDKAFQVSSSSKNTLNELVAT